MPSVQETVEAERFATNLLQLVADHPGHIGRVRAARTVGGLTVPIDEDGIDPTRYAVTVNLPLRKLVDVVDALIDGGLLTQTPGLRPTLVLTVPGFCALVAIQDAAVAA